MDARYYTTALLAAAAAKHSGASAAQVQVAMGEGALCVRVSDDGTGGAEEARGSGIVGLRDRVEAAGGTMVLTSAPGRGTIISVELPVPCRTAAQRTGRASLNDRSR